MSDFPGRGPGRVLLVSKRLPELHATKDMFNGLGMGVSVATSITAAIAIATRVPFTAIVICIVSFSSDERERLRKHVSASVPVIVGLSGCIGPLPGEMSAA